MRAALAQLTLPGLRDLLPLAAANPRRYPCLFESAASAGPQARYDMLLAFPQDALVLGADGRVRNAGGDDCGADFLATLDGAWRRERSGSGASRLPFQGGWAVFLGYELAAQIEPHLRLPSPADTAIPTALALRCPAAIIVDRQAQQTILVAETAHRDLLDLLNADLRAANASPSAQPSPRAIAEDAPARFVEGGARIHEYL